METQSTLNQSLIPTSQPNAPETNQSLTTYKDYTTARLTCSKPEQKAIPQTDKNAPPQHYHQIPLMYNYGTGEARVLNDFLIEACEMETSLGIQSKAGQSGRMEHSIMIKLNINNEDHEKWISTCDQIHGGCAHLLFQFKGIVKMPHYTTANPESGLKSLVYRPRDEMTGEVIPGRAPSMFLKLFSRGSGALTEQTLFTGVDGKPINWELLKGVEMKFIPLFHFKRIYIGGGKASIQMELLSAVVTSIRARGTTTRQTDTIQRLQSIRPELIDTVAAQIAKLTADRQDQLLGANPPSPSLSTNASSAEQSTFSGIVPTSQRQPTFNSSVPTGIPTIPAQLGANATVIPSFNTVPVNMQDFTATAPQRLSTPVMNVVNNPSSPSSQVNLPVQLN